MGSGIVAVDLHLHDQPVLSAIMMWFAAAVWLILAAMLGLRLLYQPDRFVHEATSPAALTGVAGTAVLGTRLALEGWWEAGAGLLAVTGIAWVLLVGPVLRHWRTPTIGASFVLTVATQGLAVLGATLAIDYRQGWLLIAALVALVLGVAFYVFTAARFDLTQLVNGHGDHWVAGGALAISTLACARVSQGADTLDRFTVGQRDTLSTGTLVLWSLAMLWLLPLVIGESANPRLDYDVRRWATVFPLGMYAACSFLTGEVSGLAGITDFARTWTWIAFVISLFVAAGMFRASWPVLRGQHRPVTDERRADISPTRRVYALEASTGRLRWPRRRSSPG
jgi:tellurite resistance protein TehA-like permease